MIYLLAYPRSGSSYFRYLIGYLTKSLPVQPQGHCEMEDILPNPESNPVITKFHYPTDSGKRIHIEPTNKLAILLRDPIENILSHMFSDLHGNKDFSNQYIESFINFNIKSNTLKKYASRYKYNILFYKDWPYDKVEVSYEKLVENPKEHLKELSGFFGYSNDDVDDLNIEYHKAVVVTHKTRPEDPFGIKTKGDLKKFTNMLTKENLDYICELIK